MNAVLKPATDFVPGVYLDEPAELYHRRDLGIANCGGIKILEERSPAHFAHWVSDQDEQAEERQVFTFGRAFHCATLEPDVFDRTYCVLPANAPQRPTEAMLKAYAKGTSSAESIARVDWWERWNADNEGREILSAKDYDRARFMAQSIRRHPTGAAMLNGGRREVTLRWIDEETGMPCKARVDLDNDDEALNFMLDLKSCDDASPDAFARSVARYYYHVQDAHYTDGARTLGLNRRAFIFLACESSAPYVCHPYTVPAIAFERGHEIRKRALQKQAECLKTGRWPGYGDSITELTLPPWAFYD